MPAARLYLGGRKTKPLRMLVLCYDSDAPAADSSPEAARAAAVWNLAREFDPNAARVNDRRFRIDGGNTEISLACWRCVDPAGTSGLPEQQTLERLVCASIVGAHGGRASPVETWLASRPAAPAPMAKSFAWSYMAGWYEDHGCEDFYRQVWREPQVRAELESRLRATGVWEIAEAVAA